MYEQFKVFDLGPESVHLYKCDGQVIPICEFLANNLGVLLSHEAEFLKNHIGLLPGPDEIPEKFLHCLSRSPESPQFPIRFSVPDEAVHVPHLCPRKIFRLRAVARYSVASNSL